MREIWFRGKLAATTDRSVSDGKQWTVLGGPDVGERVIEIGSSIRGFDLKKWKIEL